MIKTNEMTYPWYKEFWVWVIIGMPACVILGCIYTVAIAFIYADSIVDEYANNDPIAISKVMEKQRSAKLMGLKANINISRQDGKVSMHLYQASSEKIKILDNDMPQTIQLKLEHPTLDQYDQEIVLHKTSLGTYQGNLTSFYSGWRYLSIKPSSEKWLIKGKFKLFTDTAQTIG